MSAIKKIDHYRATDLICELVKDVKDKAKEVVNPAYTLFMEPRVFENIGLALRLRLQFEATLKRRPVVLPAKVGTIIVDGTLLGVVLASNVEGLRVRCSVAYSHEFVWSVFADLPYVEPKAEPVASASAPDQ